MAPLRTILRSICPPSLPYSESDATSLDHSNHGVRLNTQVDMVSFLMTIVGASLFFGCPSHVEPLVIIQYVNRMIVWCNPIRTLI